MMCKDSLIIVLLLVLSTVNAQFGVPRKDKAEKSSDDVIVGAAGEIASNGVSLALVKLLSKAEAEAGGTLQLSHGDALTIDELLKNASNDPDTVAYVQRTKVEQKEALQEMFGSMNSLKIVTTLKSLIEELEALEVLFQDKESALAQMEAAGMVEDERLPEYRKNPALLEHDTRNGLYMSFISLAIVGELM